MKVWFLRFLVWLSLRLHIYYGWSRVYQWLYEKRKWENVAIPAFTSFEEIEKVVGAMVWREDDWRAFGDAISMPQAAYGKHLRGKPAGDCDDHSVFAAYCIERARVEGLLDADSLQVLEVGLLTCPWVSKTTGKVSGHNVCAFKYLGMNGQAAWAMISNWGQILWGYGQKKGIVHAVVRPPQNTSLGWSYARVSLRPQAGNFGKAKLKLKPIEYHWKF